MEPWVREILRCPACGSRLEDADDGALACVSTECGLVYPVRDGIPVLLVEEAVRPGR